MRAVLLIAVCGVGLIVAPVSATIINVPGDCPTIQAGIDSSSDGDTVLVQPDTYYENINFNGHNIVLGSLFLTTGDTSYLSTTIIDGDSAGSVVTFESGEDSFAVISGLTVQNGYSQYGGGIYCDSTSPTISNNIIISNDVPRSPLNRGYGGGIYCYYANPNIRNNTISMCNSYNGGGIGCKHYSQPIIINNIISNNRASNDGGGIWCFGYSGAIIRHNTISDNIGDGIHSQESNTVISYNDISSNVEVGIACYRESDVLITNNIITNNGGGIFAFQPTMCITCNEINDNLISGGIILSGTGGALIHNNTITGNNSTHDGGGLGIFQSGFYITITYNNISENTSNTRGGGIRLGSYDADVVIDYNDINNNSSMLGGGGIYLDYRTTPTISNNNILQNTTSGKGGGIYCFDDYVPQLLRANIINNNIRENIARKGGGIYIDYRTTATITANEILNNSAVCGGGIYCYGTRSTINKNLIMGNSATGADSSYGGGIVCAVLADPLISNNILYGNSSQGYGGGLGVIGGSIPYLINNILWHDTAVYNVEIFVDSTSLLEISYCDIEGGWGGEGNIDMNPNFRDPINGDFHMMAVVCGDSVDSPCIDAGKSDVLDDSLDCDWGLGTTRSDMGAYGGNDSMVVGIDFEEPVVPVEFSLSQNYPNPFNACTVLRYSLPQPSEVKLVVYNVLGQKVGTVFEGVQQAGTHSAVWDGRDVSSGIYFAVLSCGGRSETIKMLLIK